MKVMFEIKECKSKRCTSPSGNRTLVSRVTGGDTDHYTNEELMQVFILNSDQEGSFPWISIRLPLNPWSNPAIG